jgi:hypothetical protein
MLYLLDNEIRVRHDKAMEAIPIVRAAMRAAVKAT